jgi:3-isopropylmalate/(R)-2-methylmalate dehydratase large subunit
VLATQCLLQRKPRTLAVQVGGRLRPGFTAKDFVLALISWLGVASGVGQVIEFCGEEIRALSMDEGLLEIEA